MPQSLLTVTTLADSYDLTSLETVKEELGINLTDTIQDSRLTRLIHETSKAISTICDRIFAEETVSEVFRLGQLKTGDGRLGGYVQESLILRRRPISSIVSVVEDDVTVDSAEYECDFQSGLLYRLTTEDFRTGWSANKITVNYISGWLLLDDLPYDIERACLLWIKSFYAQSRRSDVLVRVEDVPGLMRKEYFSNSQLNPSAKGYDPPAEVMVLLSSYIEIAIR
jgi:hypothetical protein